MTPSATTASLPDPHALPLDDAIGQTLCFGWQGPGCDGVNDHAHELIEDMRVGGVILLARNITTPDAVRSLLSRLQGMSGVPLLVAVDQEGGRVNRFGAPFTQFAGNMALGACGDEGPMLTKRQAEAQATELLSVGVNWNLAPVLDVNNNPDNPVVGVRSYGEVPEHVGALGAAAIAGYGAGGILSCAKHFPGHGNTAVDSHLGLPVVHASREELRTTELAPFRAAIQAGVPAIMTTHIVFPSLDYCLPATLSASILTDLLRTEMGFGGVIITDCMEMAAIAETIGTPHGAVAALMAGVDMVLVSHTLETQRETVRAIRRAIEGGILEEARIRDACARVLRMKSMVSTSHREPATRWQWPQHADLEMQIARRSVTLVRDGDILPLSAGARVMVASTDPAGRAAAEALRSLGFDATWHHLGSRADLERSDDILADMVGCSAAVVLVSLNAGGALPERAITSLVERARQRLQERLILAAIGTPYDMRAFPDVPTALCTYGSSERSMAALAEALAGVLVPRGALPVTISPARSEPSGAPGS
ncbi:MAG: beta-N-acetylhexosaminidase [Chthonomonadales bacterium]|nr:beta-N-acetylhexosaminidase [Chthonomonadales bacterium]